MESTAEQREAFGLALEDVLMTGDLDYEKLGARLGVGKEAVRLWLRGHREPATRAIVFEIERMLGCKPGQLSRHLGFLPLNAKDAVSVADALLADGALDDQGRRAVLAVYDVMRRKK